MILVIPAIDLLEEFCVRRHNDAFEKETVFFDDPVKMAKLWRVQNAKALHVAGHDPGDTCRRSILRAICKAVDIPIQLQIGIQSNEAVESAFDSGVYRVIIEVVDETSVPFFSELMERFGKSKVVAGIHSQGGWLRSSSDIRATEIAERIEELGCKRIVTSDMYGDAELTEENFQAISNLLSVLSRTRVTAAGGISGFDDLMRFNEMQSAGLDSVIIGRALYENRFPCQQSWCWNYKDEIDLSRFTSARLAAPGS